jgi:hypothetical protein
MSRFVEGEDRRQPALLPSCLEDYVSEDNPARIGHDANRQTLVVVNLHANMHLEGRLGIKAHGANEFICPQQSCSRNTR